MKVQEVVAQAFRIYEGAKARGSDDVTAYNKGLDYIIDRVYGGDIDKALPAIRLYDGEEEE